MSRSEAFAGGAHSHEYSFTYAGDMQGFHTVNATHIATGDWVGNLDWGGQSKHGMNYRDGDTSRIRDVYVDEEHRQKGLATAMFNYANQLSQKHAAIPSPEHSPHRTDMGDNWAHSTGHFVPEREYSSEANSTSLPWGW
jgi:GNAT superfamily N-acetyltransferase